MVFFNIYLVNTLFDLAVTVALNLPETESIKSLGDLV